MDSERLVPRDAAVRRCSLGGGVPLTIGCRDDDIMAGGHANRWNIGKVRGCDNCIYIWQYVRNGKLNDVL